MGSDEGRPEVPGFEVLEPVAAGGRGEIYLARDLEREGALVALKFLRAEDLEYTDRVRAFLDEVAHTSLLEHPTVVKVYKGGFVGREPYLAMEYVDGITLWEILERARRLEMRLPLGASAYVTAMVADALAYAHALEGPDGEPLGLVHRDVSTVNVMVTFDGAVKLVDFGIARSKLSSLRTAPGIVKGKLDYLSPEQCTGGTVDAQTDIYSLGVVLYELITGRRPYADCEFGEFFDRCARGDRPKVHKLRPDVSPRLERVVDRAMAVKKKHRYGTASAMLKDVRGFMDRLPERPTSSTLAALLGELAPAEVARVQASYGPPDTTAVSSFDNVAEAMLGAPEAGPDTDPDPVPPSLTPETAAAAAGEVLSLIHISEPTRPTT